jgi:hypothetical protein
MAFNSFGREPSAVLVQGPAAALGLQSVQDLGHPRHRRHGALSVGGATERHELSAGTTPLQAAKLCLHYQVLDLRDGRGRGRGGGALRGDRTVAEGKKAPTQTGWGATAPSNGRLPHRRHWPPASASTGSAGRTKSGAPPARAGASKCTGQRHVRWLLSLRAKFSLASMHGEQTMQEPLSALPLPLPRFPSRAGPGLYLKGTHKPFAVARCRLKLLFARG